MTRPEDSKAIEILKSAKTARQKIYSWGAQSPKRDMEGLYQTLKLFVDKAPWLIETYGHKPLADMIERGILDRKTRELVILGMLLMIKDRGGVIGHVANALDAGVTEEEILAVAECACYESVKPILINFSEMLTAAFETYKRKT